MNSEKLHALILNLTDKIDLQRGEKSITTIINLKYQSLLGMISLNYLMDHILYQIFKSILSNLKKQWRKKC